MVIAHGPDGYISPSWYATKREHGQVVPTWNYLTAHIYGPLVIHDDVGWLEKLVRRLTDRQEADRSQPWSVDDAPRDYTESQLRAIVGIELRISRVEAKAKLGQNRLERRHRRCDRGAAGAGGDALSIATSRGRRR